MKEQEQYRKMLKKMIDKTKSNKIQTADQLIQELIFELNNHIFPKQKKDMEMESFAN